MQINSKHPLTRWTLGIFAVGCLSFIAPACDDDDDDDDGDAAVVRDIGSGLSDSGGSGFADANGNNADVGGGFGDATTATITDSGS